MFAVVVRRCAVAALPILLCACAHTPPDEPSDPFEPFNRAVYGLNEKLDDYVAQPVARRYVRWLPQEFRTGINNFLGNAGYPTVIINDFLQGKFSQGAGDTGRFLFNSTVGVAGLLDPATTIGLEKHDEDFGQTFGKWGLGQGWFLMLPLLGPTTNRDLVGRGVGTYSEPVHYSGEDVQYPVYGVSVINTRANLLGVEGILKEQFDRYAFVRGAYLQRRLSLTYDGNPPKELLYGIEPEE